MLFCRGPHVSTGTDLSCKIIFTLGSIDQSTNIDEIKTPEQTTAKLCLKYLVPSREAHASCHL